MQLRSRDPVAMRWNEEIRSRSIEGLKDPVRIKLGEKIVVNHATRFEVEHQLSMKRCNPTCDEASNPWQLQGVILLEYYGRYVCLYFKTEMPNSTALHIITFLGKVNYKLGAQKLIDLYFRTCCHPWYSLIIISSALFDFHRFLSLFPQSLLSSAHFLSVCWSRWWNGRRW